MVEGGGMTYTRGVGVPVQRERHALASPGGM